MLKSHLTICGIALLSYFPALVFRYKIFYIAVFLTFCWTWSLSSKGYLNRKHICGDGFWFFAFFAYLLLTAVWAQYPGVTLISMAVNSIFLLVWGLSYLLVRNYPVARVVKLFVALPYIGAATLAYIYARFGAIRPFDEESMRSVGLTGNAVGLWLAASLPFLLWLGRCEPKKYRIEPYFALLLIAVSQSRAAYGLAIFSLVAHGFVYAKNVRHHFVAVLKTVMIILAVFATAYALPYTRGLAEEGVQRVLVNDERVNAEAEAGTVDAAVDVERLWTFQQGWEAFTEHPFLGVGYDNITQLVDDTYGVPITSHNILLTLIAECGWPALFIFIVLIWGFFKRTRWARKSSGLTDQGFYTACIISMIAVLLSAMAHPLLGFPLFYVFLGFGSGAMRGNSHFASARLLDRGPALSTSPGFGVDATRNGLAQ